MARTSCERPACSGCARRPRRASRREYRPSRPCRRRPSRRGSWSSYWAQRWLPGTIDVGGAGASPRNDRRCAERVSAPARSRSPLIVRRATLRALGFTVEPAHDGWRSPSRRAPQRRHARDRPHRGGRALRRLDELPTTLPRCDPPPDTHDRAAPAPPRDDALVGRGLHEIVGWTFTDLCAARPPAPARKDHALRRVVTLENPLSDAQSIMRPTLLGSLLEAARHNAALKWGLTSRSSSPAPCTARPHRPRRGRRRRPAVPRGRTPRARLCCSAGAPGAALVARRASRGRLLRRQGAARSAARPLRPGGTPTRIPSAPAPTRSRSSPARGSHSRPTATTGVASRPSPRSNSRPMHRRTRRCRRCRPISCCGRGTSSPACTRCTSPAVQATRCGSRRSRPTASSRTCRSGHQPARGPQGDQPGDRPHRDQPAGGGRPRAAGQNASGIALPTSRTTSRRGGVEHALGALQHRRREAGAAEPPATYGQGRPLPHEVRTEAHDQRHRPVLLHRLRRG